jgi:superfamily II DNA or RNA helicase
MNFNALYTDFWEILGTYLSPDDLFSFMITCKQAYRACNRDSLRRKISYPMMYPWRLTFEQRELIRKMEEKDERFKLIHGDVGSGKTIVSTSYAIRNYTKNPAAKVVMCGPPNLIKMWWTTLQNYFGIHPCILHGTDSKYDPQNAWKDIPAEQFILVSYRLLGFNSNLNWFDPTRDLLIIDEVHHQTSVPVTKFKEIIGLSATTTKASGLSKGIKAILYGFNQKAENCTYTLNKNIIAKALPAVEYYPYLLPSQEDVSNATRRALKYNKDHTYDLTCLQEISRLISHPEALDLNKFFTSGNIMIGRKSLRVDIGNTIEYQKCMEDLKIENPNLTTKEYRQLLDNRVTFDIRQLGVTYPKYVQAYHIIKRANDQGEKVLLFDNSVTYLPFIHQFLIAYGINSYLFSTHYDVTGRQRQLTKFKEDKKPGVLLSSIGMLGEGQNITEANHVIFFAQNIDSSKYHQAVGRCWRYPQKKVVRIHLLFGNKFDRAIYEHACGGVDIRSLDWAKLLQ